MQTVIVSLALGTSKAGLTDLRAQLYDAAGTLVGSAISSGFTAFGAGNYSWYYASVPEDFTYGSVKFYSLATSATTLAIAAIAPADLILPAILDASGGGGGGAGGYAGDGDIAVNHDTGGTDSLRYMSDGVGVDGARVRAYLTADYDAGIREVVGESMTGSDGRWINDMMLDAGEYTLTFAATGFQVYTVEVTVAA